MLGVEYIVTNVSVIEISLRMALSGGAGLPSMAEQSPKEHVAEQPRNRDCRIILWSQGNWGGHGGEFLTRATERLLVAELKPQLMPGLSSESEAALLWIHILLARPAACAYTCVWPHVARPLYFSDVAGAAECAPREPALGPDHGS